MELEGRESLSGEEQENLTQFDLVSVSALHQQTLLRRNLHFFFLCVFNMKIRS